MRQKHGYKRSDIWLYVQNRMSREEETAFQQHLLHCQDCRDELARLRLMVHAIRKKERRVASFRVWLIAASIACVVVGSGVYYWGTTGGEDIFMPGGTHELKVNPPVLYDDKDSVAPQDSILEDTAQIYVVE